MFTAIAAAAGIAAFALTYSHPARRSMKYIVFAVLGVFFAFYIFTFSTDLISFYLNAIISRAPLLVSLYFIVFLAATALFYFLGGIYFIYISIYKLHKKEV